MRWKYRASLSFGVPMPNKRKRKLDGQLDDGHPLALPNLQAQ